MATCEDADLVAAMATCEDADSLTEMATCVDADLVAAMATCEDADPMAEMPTCEDAVLVEYILIQDTTENPSTRDVEEDTGVAYSTTVFTMVQWLLQHCEIADGSTVPRSTLYNSYSQYCEQNKFSSIPMATFGKIIHSVFLGLRTRRLGVRGNSKYYYSGIRLAREDVTWHPESTASTDREETPPAAVVHTCG
jgi:hypothetical protein